MNFEEFTARIADKLKIRLLEESDEAEVSVRKLLKNNDVERTAVSIFGEKDSISPSIYLEPFFDEYEQGKDPDDIVSDILVLIRERSGKNCFSVEDVTNETNVLGSIIVRLINRDRNKLSLKNVPFIEYNDLAIVFRRVISITDEGVASTVVTKSDMKRWGLDEYSLYSLALKNTERMFPYICESMESIVSDRYGISFDVKDRENTDELFVLTNSNMINGATSLLYDGMLRSCAQMVGGDIYILPSSVHELIFISSCCSFSVASLKNMVKEANTNIVSDTDFLSDNVYLYSMENDTINIA